MGRAPLIDWETGIYPKSGLGKRLPLKAGKDKRLATPISLCLNARSHIPLHGAGTGQDVQFVPQTFPWRRKESEVNL